MNRIVREHYPVSKLPEDLREGFEGQADVRVTLDGSAPSAAYESKDSGPRPLSYFRQFRRSNYTSMEEINAYVGRLRDEWAERDR